MHIVESTDNLDLAILVHRFQYGTVLSNILDCPPDTLFRDHVYKLFILTRFVTFIFSEMFDCRPDILEHRCNITKLDIVYRPLDRTAVFMAKY